MRELMERLEEAKKAPDLVLRDQIRDNESKFKLPELGLPSEDTILDAPGAFTKYFKRVIAAQEKIAKAIEGYEKMGRSW